MTHYEQIYSKNVQYRYFIEFRIVFYLRILCLQDARFGHVEVWPTFQDIHHGPKQPDEKLFQVRKILQYPL